MKKVFEVDYQGHQIQVVNSWWHGEKLFVNGQLQDQKIGFALRSSLSGNLNSGDGTKKVIKVRLGGHLSIHCRIFVEDVLIYPPDVD